MMAGLCLGGNCMYAGGMSEMSKIGFLGCGRMAGALAGGIVGSGVAGGDSLCLYDVNEEACRVLAERLPGARVASSAREAASCPIVLLCVKPKDVAVCLGQADEAMQDSLLISIAAGVTLATLRRHAPTAARLVRVMPNTPALVGCGASAYAAGPGVTKRDRVVVEKLLSSVGKVIEVDEFLMDAVTGLSGSGPAFVYLFIEAMAQGGIEAGLDPGTALDLAAQTTLGAARMVIETGRSPADLRDMVTSPGGTTLAGLETLRASGVAAAITAAVRDAANRSAELGREQS